MLTALIIMALIIIIVIGLCHRIVVLANLIVEIDKQLTELQISLAKHEQEHSERTIRINRKLNDLENQIKED